jgi:hypothetical protein
MRNNPSNLKNLLDSGDIDKTRWKKYFADVPETLVPSCKDCLDFKDGKCRGGGDPIECFLYGSHSRPDGILLKNHS